MKDACVRFDGVMSRDMRARMRVGCVAGGGADPFELGFGIFILFGVPGHERARRFARSFAVPAGAFRIDGEEHLLVGFGGPFECVG